MFNLQPGSAVVGAVRQELALVPAASHVPYPVDPVAQLLESSLQAPRLEKKTLVMVQSWAQPQQHTAARTHFFPNKTSATTQSSDMFSLASSLSGRISQQARPLRQMKSGHHKRTVQPQVTFTVLFQTAPGENAAPPRLGVYFRFDPGGICALRPIHQRADGTDGISLAASPSAAPNDEYFSLSRQDLNALTEGEESGMFVLA
jgi:hypothetical protein